jgi:hypothetical protein
MRSFNFAPIQAIVVFALGVVVGSGMLGGFAPRHQPLAEPATTSAVQPACASGDAVADFVCRNRWMGQHQYSYR